MTAVDYVKATLRAMLLYAFLALFMFYTYLMFDFLYCSQSNLHIHLHTVTAGIPHLSIVTNPLALFYLTCGWHEWYGYRPNYRIARRMRSRANTQYGARTIANQLVVTRALEHGERTSVADRKSSSRPQSPRIGAQEAEEGIGLTV